ncbi:hypothetical protein GCM10007928_38220 [Sulfitobacter porphyrae]|nr:hypothetical protein GCM10007928_38220 [Sulfitobacter porphyrae]
MQTIAPGCNLLGGFDHALPVGDIASNDQSHLPVGKCFRNRFKGFYATTRQGNPKARPGKAQCNRGPYAGSRAGDPNCFPHSAPSNFSELNI